MRAQQAKDIADIITNVYKVGPLTYPKIFQCDSGNEFKAEVTKMLEKHRVTIQCATMKYECTHTGFLEALNKILVEQLFKVQDTQELNDPEKVSSTWVKHLYLVENYPQEDALPEDGLYRYLLQPSKEHDDQCKRAMDRILPEKTYRSREIVEDSGNQVTYYLKDGPGRAFVKEELMLVPKDTELPPDYVQKW